ncbi:HlyD family secretion protein [Parasedimentitalea psychrophila]|uniref:Biotin/lipoyl-binding protein n=1 Tax=Parasedimentitalea psychrophila TaxID=2997337 RepID=A0A9Y2KXM2_9RHOB|nr:biotin/lipoyl-binding protein [Parasedimentitalea psychrophila]WIY23901.1 biotin/lipoyl-binding protein [Parasedimentitalea psychrophila]
MLIVLSIYGVLVYLIFGRFKLLPWSTSWKSAVATLGLIIALVVLGALNYLTPSGTVTIHGAAISVTPNVSGTVVELNVAPNLPVKKGDLLFKIDQVPFEAEVRRLEASLVEAKSGEAGLQAELESALSEIQRLEAQLEFGFQRRDDVVELAERGAATGFRMQESISTIEQTEASLRSAQAVKRGVEIRIGSRIGGVNSAVAQVEQALVSARWKLEQTIVRAPSDGVVTALTLRAGDRANQFSSSLSFVPDEDLAMTGVFSQSGAHAFQPGSVVLVALRTLPGTSFTTKVEAVIPATSEGTLSPGSLPSIGQLLGTKHFAVRLVLPQDLPDYTKRLGTSGAATLITDEAGPVEALARILFWLRVQFNYL